jgi:hypothetical protein
MVEFFLETQQYRNLIMNNNGKELLQIRTLTCTTSCLVCKNLGKVNDVGNYVATIVESVG